MRFPRPDATLPWPPGPCAWPPSISLLPRPSSAKPPHQTSLILSIRKALALVLQTTINPPVPNPSGRKALNVLWECSGEIDGLNSLAMPTCVSCLRNHIRGHRARCQHCLRGRAHAQYTLNSRSFYDEFLQTLEFTPNLDSWLGRGRQRRTTSSCFSISYANTAISSAEDAQQTHRQEKRPVWLQAQ